MQRGRVFPCSTVAQFCPESSGMTAGKCLIFQSSPSSAFYLFLDINNWICIPAALSANEDVGLPQPRLCNVNMAGAFSLELFFLQAPSSNCSEGGCGN